MAVIDFNNQIVGYKIMKTGCPEKLVIILLTKIFWNHQYALVIWGKKLWVSLPKIWEEILWAFKDFVLFFIVFPLVMENMLVLHWRVNFDGLLLPSYRASLNLFWSSLFFYDSKYYFSSESELYLNFFLMGWEKLIFHSILTTLAPHWLPTQQNTYQS